MVNLVATAEYHWCKKPGHIDAATGTAVRPEIDVISPGEVFEVDEAQVEDVLADGAGVLERAEKPTPKVPARRSGKA